MAVMAFESERTFSPSITNRAGSGAVGLLQFMPQTCASLGVTTDEMAAMTAEAQLGYVKAYLEPWAGRLRIGRSADPTTLTEMRQGRATSMLRDASSVQFSASIMERR